MKKKMILDATCVFMVLALTVGVYWYFHPTHYKFNDRAILGSTEGEILAKYDAFSKEARDADGNIQYAAYQLRENTPELIMSYDNSLWYEIYFENGVAVKVRLQKGWYGG